MSLRQKNIVTIGGGTGSFTLLSGLKQYPIRLHAIVTMADDGGSTGILRDELGVLPPGDIRQCLVALSDSSLMLRKLLNYRFESGKLTGHSFGNLLLSALEKITGDFEKGLDEAMRILNVKGSVIPVTTRDARLIVRCANGAQITGQHAIDMSDIQSNKIKSISYDRPITPNKRALDAIREADCIIIGPGNHYSSIIPNLIVPGIARAIAHAKAPVIYVTNLTNKRGHTKDWTVMQYVHDTERYLGSRSLSYVLANTQKPSQPLMQKYSRKEGSGFFVVPGELPQKRSYRFVKANLLSTVPPQYPASDALARTRAFIRHDPSKLAYAIMTLLETKKARHIIQDII